jgi:predicted dehydrogenase
VGILGCGSTSRLFIGGWRHFNRKVDVAALCDVLPSQIADKKKRFPDVCGGAAEYADYREMLDEAHLDIVCVCSYSDKHLEHTEACLQSDCHVFMEKPVGYNLEEARRFTYLSYRYSHLKVAVAYSLRYMKGWMDMKALLDSGKLGQIRTARVNYSHAYIPHGRPERGGARPAGHVPRELVDAGGNYIASSELTHATHPWDMVRYLFGEVREVFAGRGDNGGMTCVCWMSSGALVTATAGGLRGSKYGSNQHEMIVANGELGTAWMERDKNCPDETAETCTYRTDGPIRKAPSATRLRSGSHGAIVRSKNLLDAIEGKDELICSMADGAKTTEFLHAIWLSETRQIKVPVLSANRTG